MWPRLRRPRHEMVSPLLSPETLLSLVLICSYANLPPTQQPSLQRFAAVVLTWSHRWSSLVVSGSPPPPPLRGGEKTDWMRPTGMDETSRPEPSHFKTNAARGLVGGSGGWRSDLCCWLAKSHKPDGLVRRKEGCKCNSCRELARVCSGVRNHVRKTTGFISRKGRP